MYGQVIENYITMSVLVEDGVMTDNPDFGSRRRFLKTAGVVAGASTIPAVGSAESEEAVTYQESIELRDKNGWTVEEWKKFLQNNGFEVDHKEITGERHVPSEDDGGYSIQKFEKDKLSFDASLAHKEDDIYYAGVHWSVEEGWLRNGEEPDDVIGFGWDEDEFDFANDYAGDGFFTNDSDEIKRGRYSGRGVVVRYDDVGDAKELHSCSVAIKNEGGNAGERNVIFSYIHTWNNTTIDTASIDSDSVVSVTLANNSKKWEDPLQDQIFI